MKRDLREYFREYQKKNKERIREQRKQYRQTHKEEAYLRNKKHVEEHREEVREYQKQYRRENHQHLLEANREYYKKMVAIGKPAATLRAWRSANPDKAKVRSLRDKAQRLLRESVVVGSCSGEQLRGRIDVFNGCCAYCGGQYESIDHVVPLSRGGTSWPANFRSACLKCNRKKGATVWSNVIFVDVPRTGKITARILRDIFDVSVEEYACVLQYWEFMEIPTISEFRSLLEYFDSVNGYEVDSEEVAA